MHLCSLGTAYASPFRPPAPRSAFKRPVLRAGMHISRGAEEGGGKKQEGVENYQSHFVYPMTKKPALRVQFVHIKGFIMQLTRWSMSGQIRDRQHFRFSWIPSFMLDSSQPSPIRLQVSCSSARNRVMPGCYSPHVVSRHPFQALTRSHPPNGPPKLTDNSPSQLQLSSRPTHSCIPSRPSSSSSYSSSFLRLTSGTQTETSDNELNPTRWRIILRLSESCI